MHIANLAEYKEIWFQTEHAFSYLRRHDCEFYVDSIQTDYDDFNLLRYTVCGASDRMKKHVAKTYPRALIEYVEESKVIEERRRRVEAFFKHVEYD